MSRRFVFVVPDPGASVSGGFVYNERLVAALRDAGAPVEVVRDPAALSLDRSPCYLFDTRFLGAVGALALESVDAWLIVHHLDSFAPPVGRTADEVFAEEVPVLRRFAGFLVTSTFTAECLVARGFGAERIRVVWPGVEGFTRPARRAGGPLRVLLVGNLVARKQQLALLEALDHVTPELAGIELRLLGGAEFEPEYAAACRAFVAARPAWCVGFATLPHAAMPDAYREADLLVSAAVVETFGMALQEAAAAGLPILARDGGFARAHVREGINGWLAADCAAIARRLAALAADPAPLAGLRAVSPQGHGSWAASAAEFLRCFG